MANYNFETLNSIDFEHLVRDLLNAKYQHQEQPMFFRSFPVGKDQGIDLLDSESKEGKYNCIVQVKHTPNKPFSAFLSSLCKNTPTQRSELAKIEKLSPARYILATSKALTLANRQQIMRQMTPFIISLDDIVDKEDLNHLLTVYPQIEVAHEKLWFSGAGVLRRILHGEVLERSEQIKNDVLRKIRLYVPIYSIEKAIAGLQKKRFLVLIGEPGCGKTTFAEMVLHRLVGQGFQQYWINSSVTEVEKALVKDDSAQLFYFDDFLGHTRYEIDAGKANEKGLLYFVRRLQTYKNKYLIMTTRISLINEAAAHSERFRESALLQNMEEIRVSSLTQSDKLRMVQNHLAVNRVPTHYTVRLTGSHLDLIAGHPNFSPRLIEFVTAENNYLAVKPNEYFDYVISQLDAPYAVWLHAYEQQLNTCDQFLLTVLYSFAKAAKQIHLEAAFEQRMLYEISQNHISRPANAFHSSFAKLLGSFITCKRFYEGDRLDFINPSLEDFFNHYLQERPAEKLQIINGTLFLEQVLGRFRKSGQQYLTVNPGGYLKRKVAEQAFETTDDEQTQEQQDSFIAFHTALINHMFFDEPRDIAITLEHLRKVNWGVLTRVNEYHLSSFLTAASNIEQLKTFVVSRFDEIMSVLLNVSQSLQSIGYIKNLFDRYRQDYNRFASIHAQYQRIKRTIDFFFEDQIFYALEALHDTACCPEDVFEKRSQLEDEIALVYAQMHIHDSVAIADFDSIDWEPIFMENQFRHQMKEADLAQGAIRNDD